MLIDRQSLWLAETNCYVVAEAAGSPALVIDAPPDPDAIVGLLAKHSLIPAALLVTHGHVDHAGGATELVTRSGVTAYMHPDDDWLAMGLDAQLQALFGGVASLGPFTGYEPIEDGQLLDLAPPVEVIHTPGHTPGHCCFVVGDVLFSGDQLFAGSIGRTDLPGGDYPTLMESMKKVLALPDDTEVLPGHGPATTLARERRSNPFLQDLIS